MNEFAFAIDTTTPFLTYTILLCVIDHAKNISVYKFYTTNFYSLVLKPLHFHAIILKVNLTSFEVK